MKILMASGLPGKNLDNISKSDMSVQRKWEAMVQNRVQADMHVIVGFGFESGEMGMYAYQQTLGLLAQTLLPEERAIIHKMEQDVWRQMLQRAFGVEDAPLITLEQARQVVFSLSSKVLNPENVRSLKQSIPASPSNEQMHERLQAFLFSCWMESLSELGYGNSENDYVTFQAALIEHSTDPQISALVQSSLSHVTSSLGYGRAQEPSR